MKIVSLLVSLECKILGNLEELLLFVSYLQNARKGHEKMSLGFLRSFPKFLQLKTLAK